VAYGITSAYTLQALTDNGSGRLYSVDLPPLGPDCEKYVGYFVPSRLRERWSLRIGSARRVLPDLLTQLQQIDIFIHDSLHTYTHMSWEFAHALRALSPGGVLVADDLQGNRAFEELLTMPRIQSWFASKEDGKNALCGAIRIKQ
jgi:predicted O-methyltransferase YrrM